MRGQARSVVSTARSRSITPKRASTSPIARIVSLIGFGYEATVDALFFNLFCLGVCHPAIAAVTNCTATAIAERMVDHRASLGPTVGDASTGETATETLGIHLIRPKPHTHLAGSSIIPGKVRHRGELPRPTPSALRASVLEVGASCFCVGTCTRRTDGRSGSRLRRRFPRWVVRSVPLLPGATLGPNRRCTLLVVVRKARSAFRDDETASPVRTTCEHRRKRGERLTTAFDRAGSKDTADSESELCGRCIPSLLAPPVRSALAEEGGLSASIQLKEHPSLFLPIESI